MKGGLSQFLEVISLAPLVADSTAKAISIALLNESALSASNFFCVCWSLIPHTILSQSITSNTSPKLQDCAKALNSDITATDSPSCCILELNL